MKRLQLLPIAIFALFFFLMNWYILGGLQVVAVQNYVPAIFWFVNIVSVFSVLYAIQGIQTRGMGMFFKIATHAFLTLFVSELIFAINLLLEDIYRVISGIFHLIFEGSFVIPSRRHF